MLNNISNGSDVLANSDVIKQKQELLGIDKRTTTTNPYDKRADFTDKSDISSEAKSLYEKYQQVQRYKKLVLDSLKDGLTSGEVANLIIQGKAMSNNDLAESLSKNSDFLGDLLANDA